MSLVDGRVGYVGMDPEQGRRGAGAEEGRRMAITFRYEGKIDEPWSGTSNGRGQTKNRGRRKEYILRGLL